MSSAARQLPFSADPDSGEGSGGEAPRRPPWGFWHIVTILVLSAIGWLAIGLPLAGALMGRTPAHSLSIGTALVLTGVLYAILYLAIFLVIRSSGGWGALGYRFPGWGTVLAVLAFLPAWYAILAVAALASSYVINRGQPIPSNVTDLFGPGGLRGVGPPQLALAFMVAAVVAPIVEEALFRGVLYQWLRGRLGVPPAVVLSALVFACAHLISGVQTLWKLVPVLFVMGCILAVTFQRTRSLYASMLLHGANNALAIVALLVGIYR